MENEIQGRESHKDPRKDPPIARRGWRMKEIGIVTKDHSLAAGRGEQGIGGAGRRPLTETGGLHCASPSNANGVSSGCCSPHPLYLTGEQTPSMSSSAGEKS